MVELSERQETVLNYSTLSSHHLFDILREQEVVVALAASLGSLTCHAVISRGFAAE